MLHSFLTLALHGCEWSFWRMKLLTTDRNQILKCSDTIPRRETFQNHGLGTKHSLNGKADWRTSCSYSCLLQLLCKHAWKRKNFSEENGDRPILEPWCFGKRGTENRMSSVLSLFSFHNMRTVQHFLFNWTNHFTSHAWPMPPTNNRRNITPPPFLNFPTDMSLPTGKDKLLSGKYTGISGMYIWGEDSGLLGRNAVPIGQ